MDRRHRTKNAKRPQLVYADDEPRVCNCYAENGDCKFVRNTYVTF